MPMDAQRYPAGLRLAENRLDSGMYRQSYSEGYRSAATKTPPQNANTPRGAVAQDAFLTNSKLFHSTAR